jgi:hypothetical protein
MKRDLGLPSLLLCLLAMLGSASATLAGSAEQLLQLIPNEAHWGMVVPNLKSCSHQLGQMLEGMGRENLLLGSRPIDQAKSITGMNVAVDDLGAAGLIIFDSDSPEPHAAVIVPVTDAQAFLKGNFQTNADGSYRLGVGTGGMVVYAKALGTFVALARSAEVAARFGNTPPQNSLETMATALGDQFNRVSNSGDAYLFVTQHGSESMKRTALNFQQQFAGAGAPPIGKLDALGDIQAAVLAFDFDPLALVMRSLVRFKPDAAFANIANQHEERATLTHLPQKPFYLAASADFAGIGGEQALQAIAHAAGWNPLPQWLASATAVEFAAYPSPLGLSGGILNDAAMFIQTSDPAGTVARIKQFFTAQPAPDDRLVRQIKWEDERTVEGVGTTSAYEVKIIDVPPELAQWRMAEQFIVGRSGWRGFVHQAPTGVIMTFSQRPAVLKSAVESAAAGAPQNQQGGLGSMAVIRSMRQWLPMHSDLQLYFSIGQFGALAKELSQALGEDAQTQLPDFDSELPPIAIGVDFFPGGIESSTVIPTGVLTPVLDHAMSQRKRSPAQAEEP